MSLRIGIDRRTLQAATFISILVVLIIVIGILGFSNILGRFVRLAEANEYVNGVGELENNHQILMNRYFELKKLKDGLIADTTSTSYNSQVGDVIEKLKTLGLELDAVEYSREVKSQDIVYLPVEFGISGEFSQVLRFIEFVENEVMVMGFDKLEIKTIGASDSKLEISATINFYRFGS